MRLLAFLCGSLPHGGLPLQGILAARSGIWDLGSWRQVVFLCAGGTAKLAGGSERAEDTGV